MEPLHVGVDLGAGSGRVFLGGVADGELLLDEVRRFRYPPRQADGHLRWNFGHILGEIVAGAREAGARARAMKRRVASIGVDGWGVDYGLLDAQGHLVEDPVCYRDDRTRGAMAEVLARMPRADIFARTGIQFLDLNTLFQLHAHVASGLPASATRLLLFPDLVHFCLCGTAVTEYTNATTTQFVNATTGRWDQEILERLGLPAHLLADIVAAGTDLGPLHADAASRTGLAGAHVVAPATHDTASAIAGAPLDEGWAFISSGTWSLVGVERLAPLTGAATGRRNFSNEGGAFGTFDLLKNVMGLWILESCRDEWRRQGLDASYDSLLRLARAGDGYGTLIFPDDQRFFNPPSMLEAIAVQLAETGQDRPTDPPTLTGIILDSMALRYASVLRTVASMTGRAVRGVQIIGGGSQNEYLNQATASATGLPVRAGPVEAAVTGNVLVQAISRGRFGSLAEARRHVAAHARVVEYGPRPTASLADAMRRYADLEARFEGDDASA